MAVTISSNKTGEQTETLSIAIGKSFYLPQVDKAIKDYGKKAQLKGFRPGKAPIHVIKQMVGNSVMADALMNIVNEELKKYLQENKIHILGDPLPVPNENLHIDISNPTDVEFLYEIGLAPVVNLELINNSVSTKKYEVIIDETLLDREIEAMRKRYGQRSTVTDLIVEGDLIKVDVSEINFSGEEIENGVKTSTVLSFDLLKDDKVKEELKKHKAGEVIRVDDIFSLFDRAKDQVEKFILDIKEPLGREISPAFNMAITEVTRLELHELNQEFFNKIYGEGKINSMEEFRNRVEEEVRVFFGRQSEMKLDYDIREKILEVIPAQLPDGFLKKWIQATNEKQITDDQIEAEYSGFAKNLKWQLIVNRIAENQELKVDDAELTGYAKERLKRSYGLREEDFDNPNMQQVLTNVLQNKDEARKAFESVLQDKVFAHLKSVISIETENITLEKFNELV